MTRSRFQEERIRQEEEELWGHIRKRSWQRCQDNNRLRGAASHVQESRIQWSHLKAGAYANEKQVGRLNRRKDHGGDVKLPAGRVSSVQGGLTTPVHRSMQRLIQAHRVILPCKYDRSGRSAGILEPSERTGRKGLLYKSACLVVHMP